MTGEQIVARMAELGVEVTYQITFYSEEHVIFADDGACLLSSDTNEFHEDDFNDYVLIKLT